MREWSDEFNPFNTWKVLFASDWLRAIADGNFKPPVTVDVDPSNACDMSCVFCNSKVFRKASKYQHMPSGHLLKIADFLKDWKILSCCIGGGGEPLLNPETKDFITRTHNNGIEVGLITNGTKLTEEVSKVVVEHTRFVGVSCEAACKETYFKVRNSYAFDDVIENIQNLNKLRVARNPKLDMNMKCLIHPYNIFEIFHVAKMAKELGCCGIHIRPVAIENVPGVDNPFGNEDKFSFKNYMDVIDEQLDKCFSELEDETFNVYAVRHKFGKNMEKTIKFKKCRATPLTAVFCADGNVYPCFNIRGKFKLTSHYPNPEAIRDFWGTDEHKAVLDVIDPEKDCTRCTYNRYNGIIEEAILEDKMFWKFP